MYVSLRLRSEAALDHLICELGRRSFIPPYIGKALSQSDDDMASRALTTSDLQSYRAHAGDRLADPMERTFTPIDGDGAGHVKVVVRVRKFIMRGNIAQLSFPMCIRLSY